MIFFSMLRCFVIFRNIEILLKIANIDFYFLDIFVSFTLCKGIYRKRIENWLNLNCYVLRYLHSLFEKVPQDDPIFQVIIVSFL